MGRGGNTSGMNDGKIGVLFVCLGNICRSPLAKVVFIDQLRRRGLESRFHVDSCGTGAWHVGRGADPRSVLAAGNHGLGLEHVARQFDAGCDLDRFDVILAMDGSNLRDLLAAGADPERTFLIRSFDPTLGGAGTRTGRGELDVPDPYHGAGDGFERVYGMLERACEGMLDALVEKYRV